MRHNSFSLILSAAALLGCSLASAQTLTIDSINTSLLNVSGQASVTIDPVSGNVVVKSATGSACTAVPAPTASVSGPTSGTTGATVTVNWTSTNTTGATPCTPSSNPVNSSWNTGASAASGSRQVTLPSSTGTQTLTMTCSGTTSPPAVSSLSIAVSPPGSCGGTPTDGMVLSGFPSTWADVFAGSVFPNPYGNARGVSIDAGQVAAIAFVTGSGAVNPNGQVETAEQSGMPGGPLRISLSRCQGDFRESLRVNQRCATTGTSNQQQLVYLTGGAQNANACALTPQTQYYLNVTHRVVSIPTGNLGGPVSASECGSFACNTLVATRLLTRAEEEALGIAPND